MRVRPVGAPSLYSIIYEITTKNGPKTRIDDVKSNEFP